MPTSRFANSFLRSASQGLTPLAAALGGGAQTRQQAAADEETRQSRIAQALSQIRQNDAQADHYGAQAAQQRAETANLARRPEQYEELAAYSSGQPLPLVQAFRNATRTGAKPTIPGEFLDGPNPDGSAGVPAMIPPEVQSKIAQELVRLFPVAANTKDFAAGDWAKSQDTFRDMDLSQGVIEGRLDRNTVAGAQASAAGKNQYNADASGSVLDLFRGSLDTANPMAKASIDLKGAQSKAQIANAEQSYAAARNSDASAAKTRAEGSATKPADFKDVTTLRKEFEDRPEVKNVRQAMPVLEAAKKAPNTTQGDLQLIYAVGKVLDPNSVVREGEMSLVIKSGSPEERVRGFINYLSGGGRLTPAARTKLITALEARTDEYKREYEQVRRAYADLAKGRNMSEREVFMNDRVLEAPPAQRKVVRTGVLDGRKVVQYEDGEVAYAD